MERFWVRHYARLFSHNYIIYFSNHISAHPVENLSRHQRSWLPARTKRALLSSMTQLAQVSAVRTQSQLLARRWATKMRLTGSKLRFMDSTAQRLNKLGLTLLHVRRWNQCTLQSISSVRNRLSQLPSLNCSSISGISK